MLAQCSRAPPQAIARCWPFAVKGVYCRSSKVTFQLACEGVSTLPRVKRVMYFSQLPALRTSCSC